MAAIWYMPAILPVWDVEVEVQITIHGCLKKSVRSYLKNKLKPKGECLGMSQVLA
jgi:hypothetical protein